MSSQHRRRELCILLAAAIAAPALLASAGAGWAQPYSPDAAARIEAIPIQSLTITDAQFLTGNGYGAAASIAGTLLIAQGQGPRPAVVLLPGSSGFSPNADHWARRFLAMGVSVFLLDPMSGRGIVSTAPDQSINEPLNSVLDLYRALAALSAHPRVDDRRIAVMGFSRGGFAALYAGVNRFRSLWDSSGVEPAAYIALYPPCWTRYVDDTDFVDRPVRIFHGTADDVTPIAQCRDYVGRLVAAGEDVVLTEFAGAHHAFDVRILPEDPPLPSPTLQGVGTCAFIEQAPGTIVTAAAGEPFSWDDDCFAGGHLAHSPAATTATEAAVDDLLRSVFDLD